MTTYQVTATKRRKAITEDITGAKSLANWLMLYKRNGFVIKDITAVR